MQSPNNKVLSGGYSPIESLKLEESSLDSIPEALKTYFKLLVDIKDPSLLGKLSLTVDSFDALMKTRNVFNAVKHLKTANIVTMPTKSENAVIKSQEVANETTERLMTSSVNMEKVIEQLMKSSDELGTLIRDCRVAQEMWKK